MQFWHFAILTLSLVSFDITSARAQSPQQQGIQVDLSIIDQVAPHNSYAAQNRSYAQPGVVQAKPVMGNDAESSHLQGQRRSLDDLRRKYFPEEQNLIDQKRSQEKMARLVKDAAAQKKQALRLSKMKVPKPVRPPYRPGRNNDEVDNKVDQAHLAPKRRTIPITAAQDHLNVDQKNSQPQAPQTQYQKLVSIAYPDQALDLQRAVKQALIQKYVPRIAENDAIMIKLHSFWTANGGTSSNDVALTRAQTLKKFLQDQGIANARIDMVAIQVTNGDTAFSDWIDIMVGLKP